MASQGVADGKGLYCISEQVSTCASRSQIGLAKQEVSGLTSVAEKGDECATYSIRAFQKSFHIRRVPRRDVATGVCSSDGGLALGARIRLQITATYQ